MSEFRGLKKRRRLAAWLFLAALGTTQIVTASTVGPAQPLSEGAKENGPLAVVKALYAAFEKGDMDAMRSLIAADAEWIYYGPTSSLPFAGTRKGPDGVLDFFAKVGETLTEATASQRAMLTQGNFVMVPGWEESTVKSTGGHYKVANVHLFQVEGNKIVRFEEFIDSGTVAEAFMPADPVRGRAYFTTCAGCHGPEGQGNAGMHAPALAGLPQSYVLRQLRHFQAGVRGKPADFYGYMMVGRANALPGDRGIRDVASYIATLPAVTTVPVAPGSSLEDSGKAAFQTCAACHGGNGEGNAEMGAPPIAGQPTWYVKAQLANFRKGLRGVDPKDVEGASMRTALDAVPETDDPAIAAYVATLRQSRLGLSSPSSSASRNTQ